MKNSKYDQNRVIDTYPVIVIGAGLAGLGAACQLVARGEQVLLLEKHNVPGGFATSFVRGRFEFEGALHELSDVGTEDNKGALYRFLERLGIIPDKLKFKQVPELYRSVYLDGYDVTLPIEMEDYKNTLIELFPHEKKGIEDFLEVCKAVLAGVEYIASKGGKYSPGEILKEHPWLPRVAGITFSELIEKFFTDKKLIAVVSQLWGYVGLPPDKMNAYVFVAMLIFFLKWGAVFPVGRSHSLSSAMVNAFENFGGLIRYNALVDKILVENGRVCGVELLNGDVYLCKAVISNENPI